MEIPLLKADYWQKLKFNKKLDQPKLPSNYNGDKEITLSFRIEEMKNIAASPSPSKILQQQIERDMKPALLVTEKLSNPDKLIIAARESLSRKDRYEHNGMVICERGELDIRVAKLNIPRALRFMDTLIKAVRKRGHGIEIKNDKTYVCIDDQEIEIRFREKLKKETVKGTYYDNTVYHPTGILAFQIGTYHDKEWKDGTILIEEMLSKIIAKLELIAQEKKEWEIHWKKEKEIRDEQDRIRKEFEKRKENDLLVFKNTLLKSSRWHKAVNLKNYISEVEAKAKAENKLTDELQSWLAWARNKADWYDPFTETPDELLQDIDRETLEPIKKPYSYN